MFVQCSQYGTPVDVTGYDDSGVLLAMQEKEIEELQQQVSALARGVRQILYLVQQ